MTSYAQLPPAIRTTAEQVLTDKQLDVFKLWTAGCSYRRIANMLEVGTPTIRGHLEATHLRLEKAGIHRTGARTYTTAKEAA